MFLGLILAFVSLVSAAPTSSQSQWVSTLSNPPTDWQKYVRSPSTNTITPVSVIANYTEGDVTNPNGLLGDGSGPTILRRSSKAPVTTMVLDFGQNIVGFLSIKFAGASANAGIRLAFSETIQYGYLTNVSDFSRSDNGDTITPGSDQIAVKSYPYTWTDIHGCEYPDSLQVCVDGLHGFRYLRISLDALYTDLPYAVPYGEVSIESLSLNFTSYLGTPDTFTGWFEGSDEVLTQWWYDAVYTNDMNIVTLTENTTDPRNAWSETMANELVLIDGAKRDRDPYTGDIAVSGRTSYLTHNVPSAAKDVLVDLVNHQRSDGWIPPASINNYTLHLLDYTLWWVSTSYDLYMYTGDIEYIEKYYQPIINVLDKLFSSITDPATGLVTKGYGPDVSTYGDYAFLDRTGPVTYLNVLYVLALKQAAVIATTIPGRGDDADRWSARAAKLQIAINDHLFDDSVGAFFDGSCGNVSCATHAQDGNSISIISGTATGKRAESILEYMYDTMSQPYGNTFYDNDVVGTGYSKRVYAFLSYFEIEARFISGQANSALEEIRRLYGWMANNGPGVTFWEGIQNGYPYEDGFTSMAHGWSTGIVPAVQNYILGVIPTGPGFSTYTLKPMPGDLSWANGVVPTPHGPIAVYWNFNNDLKLFYMTVDAPDGCEGTISVPANSTAIVYVDHSPAWDGQKSVAWNTTYDDGVGTDGGYVSFVVAGGSSHAISVGFDGQI